MPFRGNQFQPKPPTIRWRGKSHSWPEAGARALREYQAGDLNAVVEIYRLMLEKMPRAAELHNNLGAILQMQQRFAEALASYEKAIALKPDYANAHYNRGFTLKQLNRFEDALASYDRAIALMPNHAEALNNRGVLLQSLRRYDEALASYERARALKPDHAAACNNRGTALMSLGNVAEAEKMFRRAIELEPDFADALFNLASIRKFQNDSDAEAQQIRSLAERPGIPAEEREQLYFALGKILDDCARYDEAFDCYQRANELRNARASYDAPAVSKIAGEISEVFNAEFLKQPFAAASPGRTPIFIVGMPRSGTTLLAQALSSHRDIAAAGELSFVSDFVARLPALNRSDIAYPQAVQSITDSTVTRFVAEFEKRLRRDAGGEVLHVIDKNPLNFWHLGFIAKTFPAAHIFHCTRHPLDACLSNYFQRFPLDLSFAFDLRNIGHFYREYARLMEHWRSVPTIKMLEVSYQDMVENSEATTRRALEFLGLAWDERCRTPHLNPGAVETASHWQVRQPVYRHALERWRHYEKHLGPLKDVLSGS